MLEEASGVRSLQGAHPLQRFQPASLPSIDTHPPHLPLTYLTFGDDFNCAPSLTISSQNGYIYEIPSYLPLLRQLTFGGRPSTVVDSVIFLPRSPSLISFYNMINGTFNHLSALTKLYTSQSFSPLPSLTHALPSPIFALEEDATILSPYAISPLSSSSPLLVVIFL